MTEEELYRQFGVFHVLLTNEVYRVGGRLSQEILEDDDLDLCGDQLAVFKGQMGLMVRLYDMRWAVIPREEMLLRAQVETGGDLGLLAMKYGVVPDVDHANMGAFSSLHQNAASIALDGSFMILRGRALSLLRAETGKTDPPLPEGMRMAFTFMRQAAGIDAEVVTPDKCRAAKERLKQKKEAAPLFARASKGQVPENGAKIIRFGLHRSVRGRDFTGA